MAQPLRQTEEYVGRVQIVAILVGLAVISGNAEEILHSPNGKIEVTLNTSTLSYSVNLAGAPIISSSALGLNQIKRRF